MRTPLVPLLVALVLSTGVASGEVIVVISGSVEFNQINSGPLAGAQAGDTATLEFWVDETVFVDSASFPVRGYPIDPNSFVLTVGGVSETLQNPFPAGQTPYFSIRNDDPAVDGFMVTTLIEFPDGVPLATMGVFDFFRNNFYVTYGMSTLPSLDILDAVGTYDFAGLTVFNWTIDDGPFNALGFLFAEMEIAEVVGDTFFRRGDCNQDSSENIADAVTVLSFLFPGPGGPTSFPCDDACDANDDGQLNIADAIAALSALFGTPTVPLPPPTGTCGADPTPDALGCDIPPFDC